MAYGRRKKGGQALMDLAKRGGARRRAAKKATETKVGGKKYVTPVAKRKSSAQAKEFGARIPVGSRSSATKAQTRKPHGRIIPKDITPGRSTTTSKPTPNRPPTRTDAQRAAAKEKLLAEQKTTRAAGKKKSLTRFIPQMSVKKAGKVGSGLRLGGEIGLTAAALAGSGGAAAPALGATRGGRLVLGGLSKAKSGLSKLFKRKSKTKQPSLYKKAQAAKKQQELRKVGGRDKGRTTTPKPGGKKFQERKKLEATQRSKTQQSVIPKKKSATKKSGFKKPEKVTLEILDDLLKARNRRRRN